jgi:hypothetical protein
MRDLYDAPITDYAYTDPVGTVTRTVHRSYHGDKRKIWQGENTKARDLYRLPAVIEANKNDTTIYIVEGEKDVHVRPDRDSEAAVRGDASRASSSAHHLGRARLSLSRLSGRGGLTTTAVSQLARCRSLLAVRALASYRSAFGSRPRSPKGCCPVRFFGAPRRVLYVAIEDSWKYTLVPRLMAVGADLSTVGRSEVVTSTRRK